MFSSLGFTVFLKARHQIFQIASMGAIVATLLCPTSGLIHAETQELSIETPLSPEQHVTLSALREQWVIKSDSYKRLTELNADAYVEWITGRLSGAAAPLIQTAPPQIPTGSMGVPLSRKRILDLWSPAQLRGSTAERRVVYLPIPDYTPPERSEPRQSLSPIASELYGSIRRVELAPNNKAVALTFDLCERADDRTGYDAPIVDYLRAAGVPATFFAGGKWMRSHPVRTKQLMADPLFELGNHSWSHANLRVLKGPRLVEQIQWTQVQYSMIYEELAHEARAKGIDEGEIARIPPVPKTFRFPYGTCSPEALREVAATGLAAIQWDVVSGDPARHQDALQMAEAVVSQTKPGSIVIFHANGRGYGTAEALPHIVHRLRARGLEFVTVSQLLERGFQHGNIRPVEECYELRPGDNRRYDAPLAKGRSR